MSSGPDFVKEIEVEFVWNPGFAPVQKKKNIIALHEAARVLGYQHLLEVSTKSESQLGQKLSAFNLKLDINDKQISLECAYQGSKVFENGGPYHELYWMDSRSAKKVKRVRSSGKITKFNFFGEEWPSIPKTAFYDWLYIKCIYPHREFLETEFNYDGFTDIEFNPNKSINCQARSCALFVSLLKRGILENAIESKDSFISSIRGDSLRKKHSSDILQRKLFDTQ